MHDLKIFSPTGFNCASWTPVCWTGLLGAWRCWAGWLHPIPDSSGRAELKDDFRLSSSYPGRFATGDVVRFSARQLPTGWSEAFDLVEL